jgi:hypothetical protein
LTFIKELDLDVWIDVQPNSRKDHVLLVEWSLDCPAGGELDAGASVQILCTSRARTICEPDTK